MGNEPGHIAMVDAKAANFFGLKKHHGIRSGRDAAATETNIAYRTNDHLRWQQMDFVVGIEIQLSNNHTVNGAPMTGICDTLQGRYPKDFKFVGWHPHCRCKAITVLKTEDEMAADTQRTPSRA